MCTLLISPKEINNSRSLETTHILLSDTQSNKAGILFWGVSYNNVASTSGIRKTSLFSRCATLRYSFDLNEEVKGTSYGSSDKFTEAKASKMA